MDRKFCLDFVTALTKTLHLGILFATVGKAYVSPIPFLRLWQSVLVFDTLGRRTGKTTERVVARCHVGFWIRPSLLDAS